MSWLGSAVGALRDGIIELIRPGETGIPGRALATLGGAAIALVIVVANLIGACAVLVLTMFVLPLPEVSDPGHVRLVNAIAAAAYVALAVPAGLMLGIRSVLPVRRWLAEDRPPAPREQRLLLQAPMRLFILQFSLWLLAALALGALNLAYSAALGLTVAVVVALTGVTTGACAYLLTELMMRPAAARALAEGMPGRLAVPGVATRAVLAWALGTGIPVLGLAGVGIATLAGTDATVDELAIVMVALGATALTVGLLAVVIAARATAAPIDSVRRGLGRIERGDFEVDVPVFDGTQVGLLQLGFNRMAAGLAERERIRDAFGTYVDREVAEHILREGTDLSGEEVEVTIMFVDVRSFTEFAERSSASQVVATINSLFERAVPLIHAHDGHVDKFVGDGLLAVFGAPAPYRDHAKRATRAAIEICRRVNEEGEAGDLRVGVGVNTGRVVAGAVGGAGRLNFSVIGDAVNVAARVEGATRDLGHDVLVTESTAQALGEAVELESVGSWELRGVPDRVELFTPALSDNEPQEELFEPLVAAAAKVGRGILRRPGG